MKDRQLDDSNFSKPKLAYTVIEAAGLVSMSRSTFYELINAGEIKTIKIGRCRRITKGQLDTFLQSKEGRHGIQ